MLPLRASLSSSAYNGCINTDLPTNNHFLCRLWSSSPIDSPPLRSPVLNFYYSSLLLKKRLISQSAACLLGNLNIYSCIFSVIVHINIRLKYITLRFSAVFLLHCHFSSLLYRLSRSRSVLPYSVPRVSGGDPLSIANTAALQAITFLAFIYSAPVALLILLHI